MSKPKFQISCEAKNNIAVIRIDGMIASWKDSAPNFKSQIDALIASGISDATVYINTQGGDCFQANEIVNEIIKFPGTIKAELGAVCASAGTYIASKCSYVLAAKNCSYMIHKPMMSVDGNADEIRAQLKGLENLQSEYAGTYSNKTGLSVAKIEAMWVEDYWMNMVEAKKLGFVNEVIGEAPITDEFIETVKACGYKNMPTMTAFTTKNNQSDMITKELIITALALDASQTDAQILAHLEGLKTKAASADTLKTENADLKRIAAADKAQAVWASALKDKKVVASQEDFYIKNLIADYEGTKAMLDAMPAVAKLSEGTKGSGEGSEDRSSWTYADYQDKNPVALSELAKTDEVKFKALAEKHYGVKF